VKLQNKLILPLILIVILITTSWFVEIEKKKDLFVYYLDVGQGDSAFIDTPNGIQVLIDAGRGEKVIKELEKIIPFWDRYIDILILSHGDLDHIGGFFEVLEKYEVGEIIRAQTSIDSEYEEELLNKARELRIEIRELGVGDKIILDQTNRIYFEIYWPPKENLPDENENSLVLELIHGENEFLFTGDSTIETELKIIDRFPEKINTDILKVGHHGSKTSTSEIFLENTSPEFSILSYGENSYGHPHEEVLQRLNQSGGEILKTKERATIVARSSGQEIFIENLFNQPSFFQSLVSTIFIDSFYSSS